MNAYASPIIIWCVLDTGNLIQGLLYIFIPSVFCAPYLLPSVYLQMHFDESDILQSSHLDFIQLQ